MKLIYLVGAFALTLTFGCTNQPEKEQAAVVAQEPAKVVEKETVRVVEVETPAKKVTVEENKGTSIEVGPNGGSLKTDRVDIKINN